VSYFSAEALIAMGVLNKRPKQRALLLAAWARLFGFAECLSREMSRVGVQVEKDRFFMWTQTHAAANEMMLSEAMGLVTASLTGCHSLVLRSAVA
jgi:hypothetical protein